jgi:glycosyltransferase involved in cell wall biosynthesis
MKKVVLLLNYPPANESWYNGFFDNIGETRIYGISNLSMKLRYSKVFSFVNFAAKFFLAFKGILKTKPNDILIILDNTFTGTMCGLISSCLNLKRNILLVNMIDHEGKGSFFGIKKLVYKTAFRKIYATANSAELIDFYTGKYNIPEGRLFELADTFAGFDDYICRSGKNEAKKYDVFCGGSSHRDWELFLDVAASFPGKNFVGIAPKKNFNLKSSEQNNVDFYFDVDFPLFIDTMRNSSVCFLPLSTRSQAGQMVIFQAGLLEKPVVITETMAIKKYIRHNENGILVGINDKEGAVSEISRLLSDEPLQKKLGKALNGDIKKYSQGEFSEKLNAVIKQAFCQY